MIRLCHEDHFDPKIIVAPDLDTSLLWVCMKRGIIAVNSRTIVRDNPAFHFFMIPQFRSTNFSFIWEKENVNPCLKAFVEFAENYRNHHKEELRDAYF